MASRVVFVSGPRDTKNLQWSGLVLCISVVGVIHKVSPFLFFADGFIRRLIHGHQGRAGRSGTPRGNGSRILGLSRGTLFTGHQDYLGRAVGIRLAGRIWLGRFQEKRTAASCSWKRRRRRNLAYGWPAWPMCRWMPLAIDKGWHYRVIDGRESTVAVLLMLDTSVPFSMF